MIFLRTDNHIIWGIHGGNYDYDYDYDYDYGYGSTLASMTQAAL